MATKKGTSKSAGAASKKAVSKTPSKASAGKTKTTGPAASKKQPAAKKTTRSTAKKGIQFTEEQISQKAHEIYLERMLSGEPGDPDSDWHKAVEMLKAGK